MTQSYLGQIGNLLDESGPDLAARLDGFDTAHKSNQAGAARPANIAAGGIWTKDNGGGSYSLMLYDGAVDIVLLSQAEVVDEVEALALGVGQTWQDVSGSRSNNTSYQNTTGKPIEVAIIGNASNGNIQVSSDNSTWIKIGNLPGSANVGSQFTVPDDWYYRISGSGISVSDWVELR